MSDANRVLWSEGLFLRTQHFQQQDRFFEATVRGALQAGHLHTFGFRTLTLDQAQLDAGQIPTGRRFRSPRRWMRRGRWR
jgi:type VI secretion system protein ImpJ